MSFLSLVGIGVAAAVLIVTAGRASRFDRDRSLYPTTLVVIALLYVLFGVQSGAPVAVAAESAVALAFVGLAVVAFRRRSAVVLAAGLALHGFWDLAHPMLLPISDAVPSWWPAFCLGVDVALAAFVFVRWPRVYERDAVAERT